jgi:nucleotide-binding universal stress UspA family protein
MDDSILVATDGSPCALAAEQIALSLAAEHGWGILGLHVVDVRRMGGAYLTDLAGAVGATSGGSLAGRLTGVLEERGKAVLETLAAACAEARIPFEARMRHGVPAVAVCQAAWDACLVVLGRLGDAGPWARRLLGSTVEAASRRSPASVLVVPGVSRRLRSLLVAYDGGPQSGLAIGWAARLARGKAARVTVLAVDPDVEEAKRIAGVGCALLDVEGIAATAAVGRGGPAEEILAEIGTSSHDLVILGSSRHTVFRDWVLGGTASRVMHESPVPVLLCR